MPVTKTEIILGIDPGLAITGFGIISANKREIKMLQYGVITTVAGEPFGQRLQTIFESLNSIIKKHRPGVIAIEKLFFAKNVKTALKVGEARGVAMLCAWRNKKIIREFTPLQVKQALTGYGQATKQQVQLMVKVVLGLKRVPEPDDAADALAIAICSAQTKEY